MQEQEKEGKGEIAFALIEEEREQQKHVVGDQNVLQFLDSMDSYLTLMDSLSSRLQLVSKPLLLSIILLVCFFCNFHSLHNYL